MSARKKLLENFFSLAIVQGLNYILPLLTLPYLVRILGPEKYGATAFAFAFIQFFIIFTDYGFNLSATKEISINRDNKEKVTRIFSSVMTIKFLFLLLSFVLVMFITSFVEKFQKDFYLYLFTFVLVLGNASFPIWFFQGIEKMKFITFLNILSKALYTILIFLLIREEADYLLVNLLNGLSIFVISIIALILIYFRFGIRYCIPSFSELTYQLKEGWHIFLSTVAISFYTISNTFLLGIFTNNTVVGYYSGAEKVINAFNGIMGPLSQTIYPHINKLATESKLKTVKFISKVFKLVGSGSLVLSLTIFIMADEIIKLVLGAGYVESVLILKLLAILPFLISMSNILGVQTMLTFGHKKAFSKILVSTSVLSLIVTFLTVPNYSYFGTITSVLLSEALVTISMYVYLKYKGINILEGKYYHV